MLAVVHHNQRILGSQDIQQGFSTGRPGLTASGSDREMAGATASESVTAASPVTQTYSRTRPAARRMLPLNTLADGLGAV